MKMETSGEFQTLRFLIGKKDHRPGRAVILFDTRLTQELSPAVHRCRSYAFLRNDLCG